MQKKKRLGRKKKRLKQKLKALAEKIKPFAEEIISATLAGVITAAILKLLGW